jgi:hypothetical protein
MVLVAIASFMILGFEGSINVWKELVVFRSLDKAITSKNSAYIQTYNQTNKHSTSVNSVCIVSQGSPHFR